MGKKENGLNEGTESEMRRGEREKEKKKGNRGKMHTDKRCGRRRRRERGRIFAGLVHVFTRCCRMKNLRDKIKRFSLGSGLKFPREIHLKFPAKSSMEMSACTRIRWH